MNVGTIKETKEQEDRVGLTPDRRRRSWWRPVTPSPVERGAGEGAGFTDDLYRRAGATLVESPQEVASRCDLLVKVKDLLPPEFGLLRGGSSSSDSSTCRPSPTSPTPYSPPASQRSPSKTCRIPTALSPSHSHEPGGGPHGGRNGRPVVEAAGPGRGKLLGGAPGVAPGRAVVLGSGSVATAACRALIGLSARVTVLSPDLRRLAYLEEHFGGRLAARVVSPVALAEELAGADLLITGVQLPGSVTPRIVTREMVRSMGPGAVIIDVDVDLGGAVETARHTSHADPTYVEEGVIHYCVPNMPGAVPRTATEALMAATLPYILSLAQDGLDAIRADSSLAAGVNAVGGR